jgi:hypothetical protein
MPSLDLPFSTFSDLHAQGFEVQVNCLRCHHRVMVDINAPTLRDRQFAGSRFRCQRTRYDGETCAGLGMLSIGKARRWGLTLAEQGHRLRDRQ